MSPGYWSVVLAGGTGSRFWPLSTPERPKQLLPLVNDAPLLVETLQRLAPLVPPERTLILTNAALAGAIGELARDVPGANIVAEPRPAGTAAALSWAAAEIRRRGGDEEVMLSVHADWAIRDAARFRSTLAHAARIAVAHASLVTVGIVPTRPDPGFGYIQPAAPIDGAYRVARFVEKPDSATAATMVADGYLWNSGIFVWRVGDFLTEVRRLAPEVAAALPLAEQSQREAFFARVQPISVDHGVLERSERVLVIPGEFGWDDVGTWAALRRVRPRDADGNAVHGSAHLVGSRDNVVHAEGPTVVLYGVSDLVVVARDGLTLVTTAERSADLKTLLEALPSELRDRP